MENYVADDTREHRFENNAIDVAMGDSMGDSIDSDKDFAVMEP